VRSQSADLDSSIRLQVDRSLFQWLTWFKVNRRLFIPGRLKPRSPAARLGARPTMALMPIQRRAPQRDVGGPSPQQGRRRGHEGEHIAVNSSLRNLSRFILSTRTTGE
jgi:hypothetical protein